MFREYVDQDTKQKAEYDARRRQQELEDKVTQNVIDAEREHELELRKVPIKTFVMWFCLNLAQVYLGNYPVDHLNIFVWFSQTLNQGLAHTEQLNLNASLRNEVEYRHRLDDLERERKQVWKLLINWYDGSILSLGTFGLA